MSRKIRKASPWRALLKNSPIAVPLTFLLLLAATVYFVSGRLPVATTNTTRPNPDPPEPAAPALASVAPSLKEVVGIFTNRQTITDALQGHGVSREDIQALIDEARPIYNLAKVAAGRPYWMFFARDGEFREFRYPVDDERYLTVYRDNGSFTPVIKAFPYDTRLEVVSGYVDGSLFGAVSDAGEQDLLALELADIFTYDVDFYTDLQKGDSFRLLVEKKYLDGKFVKYGSILAAAITVQNRTHAGFRFDNEAGKSEYYDAQGKSLKKSFLKSPLKFARISSRFSMARLHPVLKIVRPHLGVDYAAPTGTPVVAVASGTVVQAGRAGAGGNTVKLHHAGNCDSMYLHLSRIAVRPGSRVQQGDVIGYVGATGLATGPHLDFRVLQHGKFVNPAKVVFAPPPPVPPSRLVRFAAVRDALQEQLRPIN